MQSKRGKLQQDGLLTIKKMKGLTIINNHDPKLPEKLREMGRGGRPIAGRYRERSLPDHSTGP